MSENQNQEPRFSDALYIYEYCQKNSEKLPQWLKDCLNPIAMPLEVEKLDDGNGFRLWISENEGKYQDFTDFAKLEEYTRENYPVGGFRLGRGFSDAEVAFGDDVFLTARDTNSTRIYISPSMARENYSMISRLADFQDLYKEWKETTNLIKSYRLLDTHPAMWLRQENKMMITAGHFSNITVDIVPAPEETGLEVLFLAETGAHREDLKRHTFDYDLSTVADSYEELIITVAKKLDAKYYPDGSLRNQEMPPLSEKEQNLRRAMSQGLDLD